VKLGDGEGFYPDGDGSRFVRLPFCAATEEGIDRAVRALARAVHEDLEKMKEATGVAVGQQGCPESGPVLEGRDLVDHGDGRTI